MITGIFSSIRFFVALGVFLVSLLLYSAVSISSKTIAESTNTTINWNQRLYKQTKMIYLMLQKVNDIERKARLFILLTDPELKQPYEGKSYEMAHLAFQQSVSEIKKSELDNKTLLRINELSEIEAVIYRRILHFENGSITKSGLDEYFSALRESYSNLSISFGEYVEGELSRLRKRNEKAGQDLMNTIQILMLLCFILIGLLIHFMLRSIQKIGVAIGSLSDHNLNIPIKINGPREIRHYGESLESIRRILIESKRYN